MLGNCLTPSGQRPFELHVILFPMTIELSAGSQHARFLLGWLEQAQLTRKAASTPRKHESHNLQLFLHGH